MPPVGFEPTIPAGEQPQTYALDRAVQFITSIFYQRHRISFGCLLLGRRMSFPEVREEGAGFG